ncbi:hypothetical protein MATL_G00258470 [Megalops atlanticus]|uniref:Uncharacterized protein n=1 Tax=Megalops atlanticus TaxID=7932 RepID=A0A9D3STX1_MEGAT|nr:hypothetical protein MATL_G00258470 [Megalops atlanticus]
MHGLPCAALQHCFGSHGDITAEPAPSATAEPPGTCVDSLDPATVTAQPGLREQPGPGELHAPISVPDQGKALNRTNSNSNGHRGAGAEGDHAQPSFVCRRFSRYPENDSQEANPGAGRVLPHIPRPSIIIRPPKVGENGTELRSVT